MAEENGREHTNEQPESIKPEGKQVDMSKFSSELLKEVLVMQKGFLTRGIIKQPAELTAALKSWLEQKGNTTLLRQLEAWLKQQGETKLTFDHIADLELPMGKTLRDGWREQFESGMSEINKKGITLVCKDQLGSHMNGSEQAAWQKFLKDAGFPRDMAGFDTYDHHLARLITFYHEFLDTLDEERAASLFEDAQAMTTSNSHILSAFKKFGIYDDTYTTKRAILTGSKEITSAKKAAKQAKTMLQTDYQVANLTEKLVDIELEETVLEQAELLDELIEDSKKLLLDNKFGQGLAKKFPLDEFYAAHPELHTPLRTSADKKKFAQTYLDWIGKRDPQLAKTVDQLWSHSENGSLNELSLDAKQQLIDIYTEQYLTELSDWGVSHILAHYAPGLDRDELKEQYVGFWKDIYSLEQKTIHFPFDGADEDGKEPLTLVFKHKDITFTDDAVVDLSDNLSTLFQFDFVIDTKKSTFPAEQVFDDKTEKLLVKSDGETQTYTFKQDTSYSFFEKDGEPLQTTLDGKAQPVKGVVALYESDTPAVAVYDPASYQAHFIKHTTSAEPKPLEVLTGKQLADITREISNAEDEGTLPMYKEITQGVKSGPDDFDRLQVSYLSLLDSTGQKEHVSADESIEDLVEEVFGKRSAEDTDIAVARSERREIRSLFEADFVSDEEIPDQIRAMHGEDKEIPAWVDQGKISYNADIFARDLGIEVATNTDGQRTFQLSGEQPEVVSQWIRSHPDLRKDEVKPWLQRWKTHEVTHRLLHFHDIKETTERAEQISVASLAGESVTLSQELICQIADGRFDHTKQVDKETGNVSITFTDETGEEHTCLLEDIEAAIEQHIPGFTFAEVRKLDAQHLQSYIEDPVKLSDLRATAARRTCDGILKDVSDELTELRGDIKEMNKDITGLAGKKEINDPLKKITIIEGKITDNITSRKKAPKDAREKLDEKLLQETKKLYQEIFEKLGPALLTELKDPSGLSDDKKEAYNQRVDERLYNMTETYFDLLPLLDEWQSDTSEAPKVKKAAKELDEKLSPEVHTGVKKLLEREKAKPKIDSPEFNVGDKISYKKGKKHLTAKVIDKFTTKSGKEMVKLQWPGMKGKAGMAMTPMEVQRLIDGGEIKEGQDEEKIEDLTEKEKTLEERIKDKKDEEDEKEEGDEEKGSEEGEREEHKEFLRRFAQLKGDSSAEYDTDTSLFFRVTDSRAPGKATIWLKLKIDTAEDDAFEMTIQEVTEGKLGGTKGTKVSRKPTAKDLGNLLGIGKGMIYKLNETKLQDKKGFYTYLTDTTKGLQSTTDKVNNRRGAWSGDKIKEGLKKKYFDGDSEKEGAITHIGWTTEQQGISASGSSFFYKVEFKRNTVKVTGDTSDFEKEMSYSAFLMFTMDKDLRPYTSDEVKSIKQKTPEVEKKQSGWRRLSRAVVAQAVKKLPEAYKYKLEQQQKFEAARFYYEFMQGVPDSWSIMYLNELKQDSMSELDSSVTKVIESYRDRLGRGDDGGDVHGSRVAKSIEKEIFENMGSSTRFRQKAAGYYLYALQKAGSAYFRSLRKYAHTGMWTRAILGKEHQAAMLQERQQLIDRLKSEGVSQDAAMDEVARHEIWYISKQSTEDKWWSTFGSRFGRWVEDEATDLGQASKASGRKEGLSKKGNIYEVRDAFVHGGIGNLNTGLVIGGLQAMEEKVEDMAHYSLFYKSVIQLLLTGYGLTMNNTGRAQIKDVCRRRGIPIGLMIGDAMHPYKVVQIIDQIASSESEGSFPTLTSFIQKEVDGSWTGKNLHAFNIAKNDRHKKVAGAIDKWWAEYGYSVMGAFNYKNRRLLNYEEEVPEEKKDIINEYVETAVFDPYKGSLGRQVEAGDPQSPFVEQGILNVSPGFFRKFMMNIDSTGRFRESDMHDRWENFNASLSQFAEILKSTTGDNQKTALRILIKTFKKYFDNEFSRQDYEQIQKALIENKKGTTVVGDSVDHGYQSLIRHKILGDPIKKKVGGGEEIRSYKPKRTVEEPVVVETVEKFISMFAESMNVDGSGKERKSKREELLGNSFIE